MFLTFTDSEHLCTAFRASTFCCWLTIFESYSSCTFHLSFCSTFDTITYCHIETEYTGSISRILLMRFNLLVIGINAKLSSFGIFQVIKLANNQIKLN